MNYSDMHRFSRNHPPSPYNLPVQAFDANRAGVAMLQQGWELYAIGWIDSVVLWFLGLSWKKGRTDDAVIEKLIANHIDTLIISDGHRGVQTCALCKKSAPRVNWNGQSLRLLGHGHQLVRNGNSVYMFPELLLHYIIDHKYQPPVVFQRAVEEGTFLGLSDLAISWNRVQ